MNSKAPAPKPNTVPYEELIDRIDYALAGADYNDVIPALAAFYAMAGRKLNTDKKLLITYMVETVDRVYSGKGKRDCPKH